MSVVTSDGFNRGNSGSLGTASPGPGTWTNNRNSPAIISNGCGSGTAGDANVAYNTTAIANDQWAQATAVGVISSSTQAVGIRIPAAANHDGYWGGNDQSDTGNTNRTLWKYVSGAFTNLANEAIAVAASDVLYVEDQGTTLKLFVNASERLSVTDASFASGKAGLTVQDAAGATALLDDWSAGDFASSGTTLTPGVGALGFSGLAFDMRQLMSNTARVVIAKA